MLFILILVVAFILQIFTPWWVSAIVPIVFCYYFSHPKRDSSRRAFWSGFAGIGAGWLLYSLYIHFTTDAILTGKVAEMIQLPSIWILIAATGLIGAVVGGIAGITGFWIKKAM